MKLNMLGHDVDELLGGPWALQYSGDPELFRKIHALQWAARHLTAVADKANEASAAYLAEIGNLARENAMLRAQTKQISRGNP